ncbi:MAG TPA: sensor domain-containing protein [Thermoleophilaceae bacterium]
MLSWPIKRILDPQTYGRITYLLIAFPLGVFEFVVLITGLSVGVSLAITLIGLPILVGTLYAWRWMANVERYVIGRLVGVQLPRPYRPAPAEGSWWQRLGSRIADPATWKDLAFLMLQFPLGTAAFVIALVVLVVAFGTLLAPLYFWAVPDGIDLIFMNVDTLPEALAAVPIGVILVLVGIPALDVLGRLYGMFAGYLLGSNADPELTAEVTELRDARARVIAAADAERRRLERDLHDGAQQRLVSLALTLRMAEKRAAAGDPQSAELVRRAGEEATLALEELRDLARGIHPAILTNRGLPAALEDLAARATVATRVTAAPEERLPEPVEAAAYFVVSEALANVGKHAQATEATVGATVEGGVLVVEVGDDGVGGATTEGSGLQGLEDRVGAAGGRLELDSPAGEGTRLVARIPLVPARAPDEAAQPAAPYALPVGIPPGAHVLPDADVDALLAWRRRGVIRVALFGGVVGFVLVMIWLLTGAPSNLWPVWSLIAIAMAIGLVAWHNLVKVPLRESGVPDLQPERDAAVRAQWARRATLVSGGSLAIVNTGLIGFWAAGGAGYFWPAWTMLGSAVAIALKWIGAAYGGRRGHARHQPV